MSHINVALLVIAFPIAAILFGMFAMGILTFKKLPPEETKTKPTNERPPPRPKKPPPEPELTEKEKRRAERRAKRRDL